MASYDGDRIHAGPRLHPKLIPHLAKQVARRSYSLEPFVAELAARPLERHQQSIEIIQQSTANARMEPSTLTLRITISRATTSSCRTTFILRAFTRVGLSEIEFPRKDFRWIQSWTHAQNMKRSRRDLRTLRRRRTRTRRNNLVPTRSFETASKAAKDIVEELRAYYRQHHG